MLILRKLTLYLLSLCLLMTPTVGCSLFSSKNDPGLEELGIKISRLDQRLTAEINQLRTEVQQIQRKMGDAQRPGAVGSVSSSSAGRTASITPAGVRKLYRQARAKYLKRDFEGAAEIFQRLAAGAPQDKLAPNSRYWLAECYYSRTRFSEAVTEFKKVIRDYPDSHKASDAMLKLAYCYHMLKDGKTAMAHLKDLLARYPKSNAARMVRKGQTVFKYP